MNQKKLQENIFGTSNINLLKLSEENPYCGIAHYFAFKDVEKKKEKNNALAAKASLFFNNSYYLQLLLQEEDSKNVADTNILKTEITSSTENIINKEPVIIFDEPIPTDKKIETYATENNTEPLENDSELDKTDAVENKEAIGNENKVEESKSLLTNILKENNTEETELSFEPLHTSDYFASQGIKLSNVVLPNDKLGLQLKSFTSWLKTMKKTHPEKLPTNNILAEVAIQKLAENSNIEAEVFTEPMAEAYVQQGKNIKAIEIYSKLSLMFPEKSAFFADKIENLK